MRANPVLARELRGRMRGARASVIITIYLAVLTGILWLVYQAGTDTSLGFAGPMAATEVASIGRGIFEWVLFFMFLLVVFLVPGMTSGAISGERERQTLIPLQVTMLRPRSIVLGKLSASIAFLLLLVVSTAPLLTISYLIGGVRMRDVLAGLLAVIFTGVVLAALTMACSAVLRRTQTATVLSYALALVMVLGTFVAYGIAGMTQDDPFSDERPPEELLLLNPLVMAADLIGGDQTGGLVGSDSPFDPMHEVVNPQDDPFQDFVDFAPVGMPLGPDGIPPDVLFDAGFDGFVEPRQPDRSEEGLSFWIRSVAVLGFTAVGALVLATRRVRTPAVTER